MKEDRRITKQELQKMYNVDRTTIEIWRRNYGLPIIEISSHSKFCRESDLIDWENSMIRDFEFNKVIER